MVHEQKLSTVLSEFARTLITDFPIQGILNHLVERIVEVLPVTAAGVTLISDGAVPHYIAASDGSALTYEKLQSELGHGPCVVAYETQAAVVVSDLAADARFSLFAGKAVAAGLAAVFAFPLRHGAGCMGALDLYCDTPTVLDSHDLHVAQTLADVAAAYLLNAHARDQAVRASALFEHEALHDPLTGLPNRRLLNERLQHATQRANRSHTSAAILFADLDRFKHVNDTYGHQIGDELLIAVAKRLAAQVRPGDTLARVSGDEFVFLCEDLAHSADAEVLAKRISRSFDLPFVLSMVTLNMTASIGVAFAGPGEQISDQLIAHADTAMYQAKRKGGAGHQVVDIHSAIRDKDRNILEVDLRGALAADQISVAYQPIVRTTDGAFGAVEALLRWNHPTRGQISPLGAIELAERSGLINEIGAWMLEQSCNDHAHWARSHPHWVVDLAVNVSGRQLMDPNFGRTVNSILARTSMSPLRLILEITETVFVEESLSAMAALVDLRDQGVRLALDDFGTGYSTLSYLQRLPIDVLKIDKTFVCDIGRPRVSAAIAEGMTAMAHALGISVTAEGIETQMQHARIRSIGCDNAQGYFYARPMPAAGVDKRLHLQTSNMFNKAECQLSDAGAVFVSS